MKLKKIINEWLQFKKISIKESSYFRYVYIINQYILPYFEDIDMEQLVEYDFNIYVENLLKFLSPTSTKNTLGIFKSILKFSQSKYDYRFNFDFVAIPKIHTDELRVLSKQEKSKLEKYCENSNTLRDIGILICLNTGLRIGEICALRWDCIDLDRHYIKVKKTMQRIYNKNDKKSIVKEDIPKTQKSVRTIPISTKLYNILKPLKKNFSKSCYFLTGSESNYIEPRNYQYMFKKCLKECKIRDFHFHQLRHTFATDCINVGMDTKSLSEILGHANVKVTLDKYVHSSFKSKKKYLEKL